MTLLTRRASLGAMGAAAGALILPRVAVGQSDNRPTITIAVQKISNTNTLDVLREQSNVGERIFYSSIWEALIGKNWAGKLETVPSLATSWKRIDDRTVELSLRQGVKFHNGDEMTAEDVAFSFGRERMFGDSQPGSGKTISITVRTDVGGSGTTKELPPEVPAVARRAFPNLLGVEIVDKYTVRFVNGAPDVTLEGRISRYGADIMNRRAFAEAGSYLDWARKPVTTGPYKVVEFKPDTMLILEAHDEYWGGRPPVKRIRFMEVPEVASRINGLLSGEFQFACDIPPDQILQIEKNAAFEVQGGTIQNHRLTVFDKNNAQLANPLVRRAFTPCDRPSGNRRVAVGGPHQGARRVCSGTIYGDMFHADWKVPDYDLEARPRSRCKPGRLQGRSRSPIACSTITTPTRTRRRRS